MIVDIARLPPDGERFVGEEPGSCLGLDGEEDIRIDSPVQYDLTARMVSGKLLVTGSARARVSLACSRCGTAFETTVSEPRLDRLFESVNKNESLDLTPEIREAIILAFPNHPVCRADCRGLCPRCGANLNQGPCRCAPPPTEGRWSALGGLNLK